MVAVQKLDHSCRRQYLSLRRQLLSKRYGPSESSLSRLELFLDKVIKVSIYINLTVKY